MKKALVGVEGYVHEIVDPGQDYEIYNGPDASMQWVSAPDNITDYWTLEYSPSAGQMVWVERTTAYTSPSTARSVAYGTPGEQLDMLYWDQVNGTTKWKEHIAKVKAENPKPSEFVAPMTELEMRDFADNQEPSVEKPVGLSTADNPAWKRYPGWSGYVPPSESV